MPAIPAYTILRPFLPSTDTVPYHRRALDYDLDITGSLSEEDRKFAATHWREVSAARRSFRDRYFADLEARLKAAGFQGNPPLIPIHKDPPA